jgi:hypothetical protein
MPSTTAATDPLSYYEVLSALWAAACSARGTDLRDQSLVNLDVLNSMPDGLVMKLGSKLRPARIEHGLGEARSGESRRIEVADADTPALPHQPRGQLVQEVLATVRDLGVDGPRTRLACGTLSNSQRLLVFSVPARRLDFLSRGERSEGLQTEVDADLPGPTGILSEAAAEDPPLYRTAEPNPVPAPEEDGLAAIVPDLVHRPSLSLKMPPGRILDPAPVRKHHGDRVVAMRKVDNQDAEFSREFNVLNPPSLVSEVEPYWSEVYVQRP